MNPNVDDLCHSQRDSLAYARRSSEKATTCGSSYTSERSSMSSEMNSGLVRRRLFSSSGQEPAAGVVEVFSIRNLDTGFELDLRDEAKSTFGMKFAHLIDAEDHQSHAQIRTDLTSLWKACAAGDVAKVHRIVTDTDVNVMARGLFEWTALHYAADAGFTAVCQELVDSGQAVDIDARTKDRQTPLHLASKNGHFGVVIFLSQHKASLDAVDIFGHTAYEYAKAGGYEVIADYFLLQCPALEFTATVEKRNSAEALEKTNSATTIDPARPAVVPLPRTFSETLNSHEQQLKFSRYIPLRLIGQGAFAHVYCARDSVSGQLVALKCMKKSLISQADLLKYAMTERNILTYVRHPCIETLYECFQTPMKLVLVLEYCPGGDMRSLIARSGPLSEPQARLYAAEVFLALSCLHRHSIVYRDLKLENIVLDARGHVRLVDFGLSKESISDGDTTNSFLGTLGYVAPEMLTERRYGKMVDWYMFGCFLYEILVGKPPFAAKRVNTLLQIIKKNKLEFPREVSDAAKSLISALMNKDPKKRLGCGRLGRRAIQKHQFFEGIDWEQAYRLNLPLTPVTAQTTQDDNLSQSQVFGSPFSKPLFDQILGWSFCS